MNRYDINILCSIAVLLSVGFVAALQHVDVKKLREALQISLTTFFWYFETCSC